MRRILLIVMLLLFGIFLVACGSDDDNSANTELNDGNAEHNDDYNNLTDFYL